MHKIPALVLTTAFLLFSLQSCRSSETSRSSSASPSQRSSLVIVLDGLRPDYVTAELMPNLYALGRRGVIFKRHHSVYPTVTRVNASSIATGCYPVTHGLMGNSVYFPEVNAKKGISTGDAENLKKIDVATNGQLLTAPTLGELLQKSGKTLFAVSSGSTGSAFLLNSKVTGGGIVNPEMILPESLAPHAKQILGEPGPESEPNLARNHYAVDAYLKLGLDEIHPDVTLMWLSDPDHTQHGAGVGAPKTLEAIRGVDAEVGRIVEALRQKKLENRVNIFVTSDHGFSTHIGPGNLQGLLIKSGLKADKDSDDVLVVDDAIYVKDHDQQKIRQVVKILQKTDWIGAIFTKRSRPGHPEGFITGTMSFEAAHWNHARAADILVSANWSDEANQYGYKGKTTQGGMAGHGTSSPYDVHNTLIAAGPDIKSGVVSEVSAANIDLAPTILFLAGLPAPETMNGRIIKEALRSGPDPKSVQVLERSYRSKVAWTEGAQAGSYQVELFESSVDGTDYLDYTKVERK